MQIKTETRVGILVLVGLGIFFFMTTRMGVFRFDRFNYKSHIVYFNEVSGLEKKTDVKIVGVKVGWVEKIALLSQGEYQARATIMVRKEYSLHSNASAIVRQEGLLGTKFLEIIPGDRSLPSLEPGQALAKPGRAPVSMDEILYQVKNITHNVEEVTVALKNVLGSGNGEYDLKQMVENFSHAAEKTANLSSRIDRTLEHNESHIAAILSDIKEVARELKNNVPMVSSDIHRLTEKLELTTQSFADAATQVREGFKNIRSVAAKVDEGKGFIGKLINGLWR